jgi:Flp pilus assembly CpaE family ATPase
MNAKGGCGATTVALNTGLALRSHGSVILVDLATLGNLAVHLNVQPTFGVRETLQNLYRLDATLLAGFVTQTNMDVHLLAGNSLPSEITASEDTFAQLFTLLATLYDYVVVDLSTRFDGITRILAQLADDLLLVSQTDVTSLWTASRVKAYIGTGPANANKVQLILNRVSGTLKGKENVIERQTGCKIRWKIPNQYSAIATAIESGAPVVQVGNSEVARSYAGLAAELAHEREVCGPLPSLFVPEPQSLAKRLFTRFLTPELSTGRTV